MPSTPDPVGPAASKIADCALRQVMDRPPTLGAVRLVVVDGPSGSGKTTFARLLRRRARAAFTGRVVRLLSTDLLATWDQPFDWWPRWEQELLQPLAAGRPGAVVVTDWTGGTPRPGRTLDVPVPHLLILEGVSAGRAAIADRAGALVWVEVEGAQQRLERAVARDGEAVRAQLVRWQSAEAAHFAADRTADRADLRLDPASGVAPPGARNVADI